MTFKIVLENLKHKPIRSFLSILLIGVPVTLILSLVGISHGLMEDSQRRTRAIGADIIVRSPTSNLLSTGGAMPQAVAGALRLVPHVQMTMGVLNVAVEGVLMGAIGVDVDEVNRMSGGFEMLSGTSFQGPDDVMIDESYASEKNAHVGGYLSLLNRKWRVCGIFRGGMMAHIVFPLVPLQDLTEHKNQVTQIYAKLDNPANTRQVIERLKTDPLREPYQVYSMAEFMAFVSADNIPAVRTFVWVVICIGVVIGFAVVCLSMYMAVLQRTREIGILKSLGGSNGFILRIILAEAAILGVGGTALGILMSFGAWWLIKTLLPASIPMVIVREWWPISLGITLVGTHPRGAVSRPGRRSPRPDRGAGL